MFKDVNFAGLYFTIQLAIAVKKLKIEVVLIFMFLIRF